MKCTSCSEAAVFDNPLLCKSHFIEHFEQKVRDTIARFDLLQEGQKIAVAASGGKDSLTVLHLLAKWYDNVTAIAIDEGIEGYRAHTLEDLKRQCEEIDVPLIITSYESFAGMPLDDMLQKKAFHPCTICGTFRRHLIAMESKKFDVLATGHNADDEAQTILMNLLRGHTEVFPRGGPKTGTGAKGFTQRVKPLYFCTEKEIMTYAFIKGFVSKFTECPNAQTGFRYFLREQLNNYAKNHPGSKDRILNTFLAMKDHFPKREVTLNSCNQCGEPSSKETCKTCEFLIELKT